MHIFAKENHALVELTVSDRALLPRPPPRVPLSSAGVLGSLAGPLDGIPYAAKDNFCTLGVQTTASSAALAGFVPPYDSTPTARLRQAGSPLMGKTNMDEFGMGSGTLFSDHGRTLNPWSPGLYLCVCLCVRAGLVLRESQPQRSGVVYLNIAVLSCCVLYIAVSPSCREPPHTYSLLSCSVARVDTALGGMRSCIPIGRCAAQGARKQGTITRKRKEKDCLSEVAI